MYYEILYTSASNFEFSGEDIKALLDQCYSNNKEREITGCMIYKKREFIQLIEGNEEDIKALFKKISSDPRHSKLKIMWEGRIENRSFGNWLMGFYNFNSMNKEELEGFAEIMERGIVVSKLTGHRSTATKLFEIIHQEINSKN